MRYPKSRSSHARAGIGADLCKGATGICASHALPVSSPTLTAAFAAPVQSAGGVPVLILALQCGADADVVMHALAIISDAVSLEAGVC